MRTDRLVQTIRVGIEPLAVALDESDQRLYVADARGRSVSEIDASTGKVLQTIHTNVQPAVLASDHGHVIVAGI
jgi:YVTN family beta-propeller protein